MQGNVLGQSGLSSTQSFFTVYQQLTEPTKKEGIWIKTNEKTKNLYYQMDDMREPVEVADLPSFVEGGPRATIIKDEIMYAFGTSTSPYEQAYKYNIQENTFTQMSDLPYSSSGDLSVTANSNNIYILFGYNSKIYKYNVDTDTYTELEISASNPKVIVALENDIYIFSSNRIYKYNITNDETTELKTLYDKSIVVGTSAIAVDENTIYVFDMMDGDRHLDYKYSILTNEYVAIRNNSIQNPYVTKIGKAIYLGVSNNWGRYIYDKNLFSEYELNVGSSVEVELYTLCSNFNNLYGIQTKTKRCIKKLKPKITNIGDGLYIVINNCNLYNGADTSIIVDVIKIGNGQEQAVEAYVGNGTEWKKLN